MSRIGRLPVPVPAQAKVEVEGNTIRAEGPRGSLTHRIPEGLTAEKGDGQIRIQRSREDKKTRSLHGLHRALVANMLRGVTEGFSKELELVGVGYKAQVSGQKLEMFVGFTHPVIFTIPAGITIEVPKPTQLTIQGADKHLVGQVAAQLRAFAPPEPYKGKGIRYVGEAIRRKAGKAVA